MLKGIIEPTIAKDVLEDEDVRKPAFLKALGGMRTFLKNYPEAMHIVVGEVGQGSVSLKEFLKRDIDHPWAE